MLSVKTAITFHSRRKGNTTKVLDALEENKRIIGLSGVYDKTDRY